MKPTVLTVKMSWGKRDEGLEISSPKSAQDLSSRTEQTQQTAAFLSEEKMEALFPGCCTSFQAHLCLPQQLNLCEVGVALHLEWDKTGKLIHIKHGSFPVF